MLDHASKSKIILWIEIAYFGVWGNILALVETEHEDNEPLEGK